MKNKITTLIATSLVKVGEKLDGNASPCGFYKPAKPSK